MQEEIKEILNNLKNIEDYLSFNEAKQIEDYITNLQEELNGYKQERENLFASIKKIQKENERLRKEIPSPDNYVPIERQMRITSANILIDTDYSKMEEQLEDYKSRNEKAILFIDNYLKIIDNPDINMQIVKDILKGDNK